MLKGLFGKGALKGFGNWIKSALPNVIKDTLIERALGSLFGGGGDSGGGGGAEMQATIQAGPAQDPSVMRKRLREVNAQYLNTKSERDRELRKLNLVETKIMANKHTNEPFPSDSDSSNSDSNVAEIDVNHVNPPSSSGSKTGYEDQLNDVTNLSNAVGELNAAKNQQKAYSDPDVNGARISKLESKVDKLDQEYRSKYLLNRGDKLKSAAADMIPGVKLGYNDEATVRGFKVMNKELELLRIKQAETIVNMQAALQNQGYAGGAGRGGSGGGGGGGGFLSGIMGSIVSGLMMEGAMTLGGKLLEKAGVTGWAKNQWTKLKNATGLNKLIGKGTKEAAEELGEEGAKAVAKGTAKGVTSAAAKGTAEAVEQSVKQAAKGVGRTGAREAAERAIQSGVKTAVGRKVAGRVTKEVAEEAVEIAGKKVAQAGLRSAGTKIIGKIGQKLGLGVLGRIAKKIAVKAGQKLAVMTTGPVGLAINVGMLAYDLWSIGSGIIDIEMIIARFKGNKMDKRLWASLVNKNLTPELVKEKEWGPDELTLIRELPDVIKEVDKKEGYMFIMYIGVDEIKELTKPIDMTALDEIDDQIKAHEGGGDTRGFFTKVADFGVRLFAPGEITESQQIMNHKKAQAQGFSSTYDTGYNPNAQPQGGYYDGSFGGFSNYSGNLLFNGTGGQYTSVPISKGSGYANNRDTILAASQMVGVDPGLMMRLAASESGFQPSVKHKEATAAGLFQFIDATWRDQLKNYHQKFGIPINAHQSDARANALLGAQFVKDNLESRSKSTGLPPSPAMAYLDHWLGPGGANEFWKHYNRTGGAGPVSMAIKGGPYTKNLALVRANGGKGPEFSLGQAYQNLNDTLERKGREFKVQEPLGGGGGGNGVSLSLTNGNAMGGFNLQMPTFGSNGKLGWTNIPVGDGGGHTHTDSSGKGKGEKHKATATKTTGGSSSVSNSLTGNGYNNYTMPGGNNYSNNRSTQINTTVHTPKSNSKEVQKGQRANKNATA